MWEKEHAGDEHTDPENEEEYGDRQVHLDAAFPASDEHPEENGSQRDDEAEMNFESEPSILVHVSFDIDAYASDQDFEDKNCAQEQHAHDAVKDAMQAGFLHRQADA